VTNSVYVGIKKRLKLTCC